MLEWVIGCMDRDRVSRLLEEIRESLRVVESVASLDPGASPLM